LIIQFLLAL